MKLEVTTDEHGEMLPNASAFPEGTKVVGISPKWEPLRIALLRGVTDNHGVSVGMTHYPAKDFYVISLDD